jgi:hypothetical protein
MVRSHLTRRALLAGTTSFAPLVDAAAEPEWDEPPELRPVGTVATAADLLRGPHYELGPTVTTFAYLNRYTAVSDFGQKFVPANDTQSCMAAAA